MNTPRRSRLKRQPTGKPILLSPRDVEIFKVLNRYRYLRSTFLKAFFPKADKTGFIKRLGRLYHEQPYLNRPERQYQYANALHLPAIYELGELGEQVLKYEGMAHLAGDRRTGESKHFAHALMACDILASIELGCGTHVRFMDKEEALSKAPSRGSANPLKIPVGVEGTQINIIPDALFGLGYAGQSYRFFALEADRGTMPIYRKSAAQTSYHRKLLAYWQILAREMHRSHFGVPNLLILTVTTSVERMRNIMADLKQMTDGKGHAAFLFKTMKGDIWKSPPADAHMLAEPWERVGHPPVFIARP